MTKQDLQDTLDELSEQIDQIEETDAAYARGFAAGKDTLTVENYFFSLLITLLACVVVFALWVFIHWASWHEPQVITHTQYCEFDQNHNLLSCRTE